MGGVTGALFGFVVVLRGGSRGYGVGGVWVGLVGLGLILVSVVGWLVGGRGGNCWCLGCGSVVGYSGGVRLSCFGVGGRHVNFLFTVKPLRLLPMVVMGFWRGFIVSSFGGGLVASAWGGLVPMKLWVA